MGELLELPLPHLLELLLHLVVDFLPALLLELPLLLHLLELNEVELHL